MKLGTRTPENKKMRKFQLRWREPLGNKDCPYAYRWTLNLWLFAVRVHQWITTEDSRNLHDHPWNFITLVVKGGYTDVSHRADTIPHTHYDKLEFLSLRYRKADHRHYVMVNEGGCWTVLLTGPVIRNWGYWVNGKLKRPLRYFGKYGHPPCHE